MAGTEKSIPSSIEMAEKGSLAPGAEAKNITSNDERESLQIPSDSKSPSGKSVADGPTPTSSEDGEKVEESNKHPEDHTEDAPSEEGEEVEEEKGPPSKIIYKIEYREEDMDIIGTIQVDNLNLYRPQYSDDECTHVFEEVTTVVALERERSSYIYRLRDAIEEFDKMEEKDPSKILAVDFRSWSFLKLVIRSTKLLNALRAVVEYYPGASLFSSSRVSFSEPFAFLFHHYDKLKTYKDNHPPGHDVAYIQETNEHIDLLLDYLDTHSKGTQLMEAEEARYRRKNPVCTFQLIWLLFKPGETAYRRDINGELQPFIIKTIYYNKPDLPCYVFGWYISYNGVYFDRAAIDVTISPFEGEKDITSLECFPSKYYDPPMEGTTLYKKLVDRGKLFWRLWKPTYCEYDGYHAAFPYQPLRGRLVVDTLTNFTTQEKVHDMPLFISQDVDNLRETYRDLRMPSAAIDAALIDDESQENFGCNCFVCASQVANRKKAKFTGYSHVNPEKDAHPKDDDYYLLCSKVTWAFDLNSRMWKSILVEGLNPDIVRKDNFQYLVLPPTIKDTVRQLSMVYGSRKGNAQFPADFIKGKGEGLVFLLHGAPGVGKTATAETVADLIARPLLSLTCGDLGIQPSQIEENLQRYLDWGLLWGAVVLLDEADVFLEARNVADVNRNALVSVFLRALEYYKGLLFLTTNRVGTFDEAFKSRIHVSLHYKPLSWNQRRDIWANNFMRLGKTELKISKAAQEKIKDPSILDLEWNGREIRNAVQTAAALAQFEAEEDEQNSIVLRPHHLEKVVYLSSQFQQYLKGLKRGKSDAQIAKRNNLRDDLQGERPKAKPRTTRRFDEPDSEPEVVQEEEEEYQPRRRTRRAKAVVEDDDEEYEVPPKGKRAAKKGPAEEDEEDEPLPKPRKKKPAFEEDEEQEPPRRRKSVVKTTMDHGDDEDEIDIKSLRLKKPAKMAPFDEESEEERPKKGKRIPSRSRAQDPEEEAEELWAKTAGSRKSMAKNVAAGRDYDDGEEEEVMEVRRVPKKKTRDE